MRIRNLASGVAVALCLGATVAAQPQCGVNSIRGTWATSSIGWAIPLGAAGAQPAPIVMIGVMSIDYAGRLTGSGTLTWGTGIAGTPIAAGDVLDYDMDGTVDLNQDCTGFWRYTVKLRGTPAPIPGYLERIIVVPQKDEILSQSIRSPLSKPMWTSISKRISPIPSPVAWPQAPAQ